MLSIALLREYLEEEFLELWKQKNVSFQFSLERVIDDFVLMAFFIGNDFLPSLEVLDISKGGMEILFENYKKVIFNLDDYLSFNGVVNWKNLEIFLSFLCKYEETTLFEAPIDVLLSDNEEENARDSQEKEEIENVEKIENNVTSNDRPENDVDDSWKETYYNEKFKSNDIKLINDLTFNYLKSIQWVLHYYVHGCVSW